MTRRPVAAVGLGAVILGAFTLGGCGISLQSLPKVNNVSGATYPVHAVFANVLNLPADAQVRTGAEVVGEVGAISAHNFVADVTLDIKRGVRLAQGTTAEVRFDNPLGDEYVLLQAPPDAATAPPIPAGAGIPESQTATAPSVEDTLGALSTLLNGGGINQLGSIVRELNNTFDGNQPQIHQLLGTINTAVTTLAGGQTSVDNALSAISGLSTKLNGVGGAGAQTIGTGVDSINGAIGVLANENTAIDSLVSSLSTLGTVGTEVAQQAGQSSVQDVKALLPVVNQLNAVAAQLGPDLGVLAQFEAETPKVAPGDYLQVSVVANVLLPPGDFTASPQLAGADASAQVLDGAAAITTLLAGGTL